MVKYVNTITFAMKRDDCPSIILNDTQLYKTNHAKCVGTHLDEFDQENHMFTNRNQLHIILDRCAI